MGFLQSSLEEKVWVLLKKMWSGLGKVVIFCDGAGYEDLGKGIVSVKAFKEEGERLSPLRELVYVVEASRGASEVSEVVALLSALKMAEEFFQQGAEDVKIYTDADEGIIRQVLPRASVPIERIERKKNLAHLPQSLKRKILAGEVKAGAQT